MVSIVFMVIEQRTKRKSVLMSFILPSLIEKTNKCLINVIVTQHHRRPSEQIPRKPVVLGYIVAGFGSFWLVLWVVLGGFGWFWLVLLAVLGGFGF